MKREPKQRKTETWQDYCARHTEWYTEYWTPRRKAMSHKYGQAMQFTREELATSRDPAREQDEVWEQNWPEIQSDTLTFIELPVMPGSLGRGGHITHYIYCSPAGREMWIDRVTGRKRLPQRPADRCMQRRPHPCFYPVGDPQWCYIMATPPPLMNTSVPVLPGFEEMFITRHNPITVRLCCPQAARLQIRELHRQEWADIQLSTKSPDREVQGFVRYMQVHMPCLNQ